MSNFPISKKCPFLATQRTEALSFSSLKLFNTTSTPLPFVSLKIMPSKDVSLELPMCFSWIYTIIFFFQQVNETSFRLRDLTDHITHLRKCFPDELLFFMRSNSCENIALIMKTNINGCLANASASGVNKNRRPFFQFHF